MLRSSRNPNLTASWREAVLRGIAPDGGLYIPCVFPQVTPDRLQQLRNASFVEVAEVIAAGMLGDELPAEDVGRICQESFTFGLPLTQLDGHTSVVELFHGPTCAFKDFGARFMARLFRYFWGERERPLTVLVATSGDTGGAVANAFFDDAPAPRIRVVVLYPKGRVSEIQRRQMTTLGCNVTALEVDGSFDDCQALVKRALNDGELTRVAALTSANSINIARLLPQMFYFAWVSLRSARDAPAVVPAAVFSVPSGNLGNLTGGILAALCGWGVGRCIAAHNCNRTFPDFLEQGNYLPSPSRDSISNAMDVGNPSNFERLVALFGGETTRMREMISGYSVSDAATRETIRRWHDRTGYVLDPHTAVGVAALEEHRTRHNLPGHNGVVLATAHPAKFASVIEETLGFAPMLPPQMAALCEYDEVIVPIGNSYTELVTAVREQL